MSLTRILGRLSLAAHNARTFHVAPSLLIQSTPILYAEPLKKKKKIDPQIIRQREERRRKKIEKQIKRLERNAQQLKPIEELEVPLSLIDEKSQRTRNNQKLTTDILEKRVALEKSWATYKMKQKMLDLQTIDRIYLAQEKALSELKFESEELYEEAIQPDLKLVPFNAIGPVSTPPIEKYESPDGDYIDVSKKWE